MDKKTKSKDREGLKSGFLPYQIKWLEDKTYIKLGRKSRRTGFTWIEAFDDVCDIVEGNIKNNKVWFTSTDDTNAVEYIQYVAEWARLVDKASRHRGVILIETEDDIQVHTVKFANGGQIYALSSNPKVLHGKEGKIILDEFAKHVNQEALWEGAKGCLIWGYPARIMSTVSTKDCLFYRFKKEIEEGLLDWSLHQVTIHDAVRDGILNKILRKNTVTEEETKAWLAREKKNCIYLRIWNTQYLCQEEDDAESFLTYEMIKKNQRNGLLYIPFIRIENYRATEEEVKKDNIPASQHENKIFTSEQLKDLLEPLKEQIKNPLGLGMDIAETGHLSVLWGTEKEGRIRNTRFCIDMHNVAFSVQQAILWGIIDLPKTIKACIDKTGLGANIAQNAEKKFGSRAEGIKFSGPVNEELADNLYQSIENGSFLYPPNEKIEHDFHSIKCITTVAGHRRFDATRSSKGNKNKNENTGGASDGNKEAAIRNEDDDNFDPSHGDRFWAAALSNHALNHGDGKTVVVTKKNKNRNRRKWDKFSSFSAKDLRGRY